MSKHKNTYFKDWTGHTFQDYTVIEFAERQGDNGKYNYVWLCECVCGKRKKVSISNLKNKNTKGCGCKSFRGADIAGETRGNYTAIERSFKKDERWYWKVQHKNGDFKYMSVGNFKVKGKVSD